MRQGPQVRSPAACNEASHTKTWPQPMHSMVAGFGINGLGTGTKGPGPGGEGPTTVSSLPGQDLPGDGIALAWTERLSRGGVGHDEPP